MVCHFIFSRAPKTSKFDDIDFHTSRDYFTALEAGHFTLDPAKLNDPSVCDNFRNSSWMKESQQKKRQIIVIWPVPTIDIGSSLLRHYTRLHIASESATLDVRVSLFFLSAVIPATHILFIIFLSLVFRLFIGVNMCSVPSFIMWQLAENPIMRNQARTVSLPLSPSWAMNECARATHD